MTEKELHLLGFDKEFIDEYEGDETYYYYYVVANGLSLISCSNEDVEDSHDTSGPSIVIIIKVSSINKV